MAAFIPRLAETRTSPDRAADFRRDAWRSHGDRHPTTYGFHQYRPGLEIAKYGAPGLVVPQRAAGTPVHRRMAKVFAVVLNLTVFVCAAGIALAGLIAAIITPPI